MDLPLTDAILDYPFPTPPAAGTAIAVAPGVEWIRLPLPFRLDHINVWLLDGRVVVDCGYASDAARAAWAAATARFDGDVNSTFFDGASWEQATRIEFWTQGRAYATWLLEWATAPSPGGTEDVVDVPLVVEAACVLERAVHMGRGHAEPEAPDAFTLKNLGLAYVKLVRAPAPLLAGAPRGDAAGLPVLPAIRARARCGARQ